MVAGGNSRPGVLATHIAVAPGETKRVRFVITWNFPNNMNYWNSGACDCAVARGIPVVWKNYYATIWPDAPTSATYALREWDRLYRETVLFKEALFSSTLPLPALDAVSANLSVLKSPTVLLLEDGTFYGWEGCHTDKGSCDGTCTHVWNYQQALPFLFPKLERSMREVDYQYNLQPDGRMPFRLNTNLLRDASRLVKSHTSVSTITLGRKVSDAFHRQEFAVETSVTPLGNAPEFRTIAAIADYVSTLYTSGTWDQSHHFSRG